MKYVRFFILYLIIFVVFFTTIIFNSFLLFKKNDIKKNLKNLGVDIDYQYSFYLFPNMIIVRNFSFGISSIRLYLPNSMFFIDISDTIKYKKFYISYIKVDKFSLQIGDTSTANNIYRIETPLFDKKVIDENLNFLPKKAYFKNGIIKYNDILEVKDISLKFQKIDKKINLSFNGEEKNYKINLSFDSDIEKNKWVLKTKMFANNEIVSSILQEIKVDLFGDYDFNEFKNYNIFLKSFDKKTIQLSGKINFYPFRIEGEVKGDILKGNFLIDQIDEQFKGKWYGELLMDKFLQKVTQQDKVLFTESNFCFSSKEYQVDAKLYNNSFISEFFVKDGKGYIKIIPKKYNILKRSILSKIDYDKGKKLLHILSKDEILPFDLVLNFGQMTNFEIKGNFLGNEVLGYFLKNENKIEANLDFENNFQLLNFEFLKNDLTTYAKINFNDKKKKSYIIGNLSSSEDNKKFDFNIEFKNLFINNNKFSFVSYGYINSYKDLDNFVGCIYFKDLFYENQKIFNIINNKIYLDNNSVNIFIDDVDKTLLGEIKYDLKKRIYDGKIKFERSNLQIGEFLVNCFLDIKFTKIDKFKFNGNYKINNFYENNKLFILTEGNIYNDKKDNIILEGKMFSKDKEMFGYKNIINIKKDIVDINFYNFKLLDKEIFSAELNLSNLFNVLKDNKIKKLYFNGKVYNEDSEIVISPSYVSTDFNVLKLNFKIKNLYLSKSNFVGDFVVDVNNINKNVVNFKSAINNFWINNYFVGKSEIVMNYNRKEKSLSFVLDDRLLERSNLLKVVGYINFYDNIKFKNLKLYTQEQQYMVLNGNLGLKGDILQIKFSNIPVEILKSILSFSEPEVLGIIDGDMIITTISSFKDYKINANFIAKDVVFKMLKIPQVLLNMLVERDEVFLEKLILNFKEKGKVEIKGEYNITLKNCNFVIKSIQCNLSMFNDFYDIVKSAEGSFITELSIKGKINTPQIKGYFYLPKGSFKFKKYITSLDNTTIKLNFLNNKIEFEKFYGYYKNTKLIISGIWSFLGDSKLKVYTQGGKGIEIFIPELSFSNSEFFKFVKDKSFYPSRGEVELDFNITKQKGNVPKIEGKAVLNNTHFTYPGVEQYSTTTEVGDFYYDVTIVAKDNVWYENELISANIVGSVNLNYIKPNMRTDVNGEAIALGGNMKFLNTNFRIKSGRIQIIKRIPYLELLGETEIVSSEREKIKVQLVIDRTQIEDIKPRLVSTSHPTLKSEDITSILLGTGKLQKTEKEDYVIAKEQIDYTSLLRSQFVKLIDSTLATPIAKNILQKWGIVDNITVSQLPSSVMEERQITSESSNGLIKDRISFVDIIKNTKYGIEKYLTSDMMIGYSIALAEYQQKLNLKHELEIGYRLKGNVFIKGIYDYSIRDYTTGRYGSDVRVQIEPVFRLKSWAEEEKQEETK